jgi:hypothetical protein
VRRRVGFLIVLAAGSLFAADFAAEGKLWWAHVCYLADDAMAGRYPGTEGHRKAVEYVSAEFERCGLKPAGTGGYLQPVKFETRQVVPEKSSLSLVLDGEMQPLVLGEDATISPRSGASSVDAPMAFVGYGIDIPEAHYSDTAGIDLTGKIAVYVNAPPPVEVSGNIRAHYSSGVERWAALRRAGAIGVAVIANLRNAGRQASPRGGPSVRPSAGPPAMAISLADPSLREAEGQAIAVSIFPSGAEKIFAASGHNFAEIESLARSGAPLPHFPLGVSLRARVAIRNGELEAPNVIGVLPGSDKKLGREYVVLSAHLDHLGVGRGVNGDDIYNGAMDDASGVASVLEIARLMQESHARPKRSILFLAVTGEEEGELGSRYFVRHPTVPAKNIVADINLDMFLPLYPLKVIEVQGLTESTLGDQIRAAAAASGVAVQTDREPDQNRFIRSDQYSFIRQGIPALAFKFGYEFGSPEEKTRTAWVRTRYHLPSDDLNQPVDKAAAATFDRIILSLLERVADRRARPHWAPDSFFHRFATND